MENKESWFDRAVADAGQSDSVWVDDISIAYTVWGESGLPGCCCCMAVMRIGVGGNL